MVDYSKMTDEDFDQIFEDMIAKNYGYGAVRLLTESDECYQTFREAYNNDILDRWAEENPDKAYPAEDMED